MGDELVIFKYALEGADSNIMLPIGSRIIDFQFQGDTPCVWAIVNPYQKKEQGFRLIIQPTGKHFDGSRYRYIGTAHKPPFVWHLLEDTLDESTSERESD